jgi:hypothetical protein
MNTQSIYTLQLRAVVMMAAVVVLYACGNRNLQPLEVEKQSSLLYEISGNGLTTSSYVFGTMHVSDSNAVKFLEQVRPYIAQCSIYSNEIDLTDNQPDMSLLGKMFMQDTTLEMLYSSEELETVTAFVEEKLGPSGKFMLGMKPFWISSSILEVDLETDPTQVLDVVLQEAAEAAGCDVRPLETFESQFNAIDQMPLKDQAEMLLESIRDYDKQMDMMQQMNSCYSRADLDCLYALYEEEELVKSMDVGLVTSRNTEMARVLSGHVKVDSGTFCAVGALHLPGETGLIQAFREMGYTVEPIALKTSE